MDVLEVLDAHGAYLSDPDDAEVSRRALEGADAADLAVRTCLCGAAIDGFDEYHAHLRQVIRGAIQMAATLDED